MFIDGQNKFNIEVKSPSAQSGQFVVLEESGKLVFSSRNKSNNEEAEPFLVYMNANYDKFAKANTAGIKLEMDVDEYNAWIIRHYLNKNSQFVITYDGQSFVIFPTKQYGKYFQTTCKYRIKTSGSNEVPIYMINDVVRLFNGTSHRYESKKLYVKSLTEYSKGDYLTLGEYNYRVSEKSSDGYLYIRRLSNTRNPNVIFSVSLKRGQDAIDLNTFEISL